MGNIKSLCRYCLQDQKGQSQTNNHIKNEQENENHKNHEQKQTVQDIQQSILNNQQNAKAKSILHIIASERNSDKSLSSSLRRTQNNHLIQSNSPILFASSIRQSSKQQIQLQNKSSIRQSSKSQLKQQNRSSIRQQNRVQTKQSTSQIKLSIAIQSMLKSQKQIQSQKIPSKQAIDIFQQLNKTTNLSKIKQLINKFFKQYQQDKLSEYNQYDIAYLQSLLMNIAIQTSQPKVYVQQHYNKALNIYKSKEVMYFQEIITLSNNLAQYYSNLQRQYKEKAIDHFQYALKLVSKYVSLQDYRYLMICNNIACNYCQLGRFQEGKQYFNKCLKPQSNGGSQLKRDIEQNMKIYMLKQQQTNKTSKSSLPLSFKHNNTISSTYK